jgi:polyhydroxyalkanoate synthesis regulator phasin
MPEKSKTQQAVEALTEILTEITEDGELTAQEIKRLIQWKIDWKTVARRGELKEFTDWFTEAIADGVIDREERRGIFKWAKDLEKRASERAAEEERARQASQRDVPPPYEPNTKWRDDPITEKQIRFLEELGAPRRKTKGLTKGQASKLIDELLEQQNSEGGGCLSLVLLLIGIGGVSVVALI